MELFETINELRATIVTNEDLSLIIENDVMRHSRFNSTKNQSSPLGQSVQITNSNTSIQSSNTPNNSNNVTNSTNGNNSVSNNTNNANDSIVPNSSNGSLNQLAMRTSTFSTSSQSSNSSNNDNPNDNTYKSFGSSTHNNLKEQIIKKIDEFALSTGIEMESIICTIEKETFSIQIDIKLELFFTPNDENFSLFNFITRH